jgi:hypothetical protein
MNTQESDYESRPTLRRCADEFVWSFSATKTRPSVCWYSDLPLIFDGPLGPSDFLSQDAYRDCRIEAKLQELCG